MKTSIIWIVNRIPNASGGRLVPDVHMWGSCSFQVKLDQPLRTRPGAMPLKSLMLTVDTWAFAPPGRSFADAPDVNS